MFSEYGDFAGETPRREREPLFRFGSLKQSQTLGACYDEDGNPVIVRESRWGRVTVDKKRTRAVQSGQMAEVIADAQHQGAAVRVSRIRRLFSD